MRNNGGHSDRNKKCQCTQEIKALNTCHRKRDTEKVKPVTLCKVPRLQLRKCKPGKGKCGSAQRGDITSVPTIMLSRKSNSCTNLNHLTNSSVIKLRNKRVKDFFSFPFRLFFFVSIFGVFSSATEFYEEFNYYIRERAEAAKKWAPLVFLHPEERFFPSAVHSFLKNVIPREVPPSEKPPDPPVIVSMSRSLDDQALPEGPEGEDTYLFAPIDLECKNCPLPRFLFGDKPTSAYTPPVYAVISSCLPSQRTFRQARNHKGSSRSPSSRRKFRLRNSFPFRKREARSSDQYESSYGELSYTVKPNRPILKREAEVRHTDTFNSLYDVHEAEVMQPLKGKLIPPSITFLLPKNEPFQETHQISDETFHDPHEISLPIPQTSSPDTPNEDSPLDIEKESTTLLFKDSGNLTNVEGITEPVTELDPIPEYPNLPNFTTFHNEQNETISEPDKTRVTREPEISIDVNIHRQNDYNVNSTPRHIGHRFTVTYWMFYPFSQGKEVCTSRLWLLGRVFKPRLRNKCFGESITLNSHVGDWEHISIYFEDGLPQIMYVSMHTYGAFYNYDPIENIFVYRGRDTRVGVPLNPKYPEVVKMDGTHPVLYSALGSHGVWAGPGVHRYENLVPLDDKTAAGVPWELWKNIDIIDNQEPEHHRPDRQWLNFHGKWGNPSSNCHRALFGTCDLASGPTGIPLKRQNFPCHMPNHSTFSPKS